MLNERFRVIKEYLGKESLLKNMGQEFWTPTVLQRCGKIAELIKMKPEWTDNELRKYIAENNIGYNAVSFTRAFRILEEKYKKERIEEINSSSEEVATSYEE
jgi:transposase